MASISTVVDTGGTGDYTSMGSANADYFGATGYDYVTNQDIVDITLKCTDGNADTSTLDTAGYTTDPTYTVTAITVDPDYRHAGKYPSSGNIYRREPSVQNGTLIRTLTNTVITGLAIKPNRPSLLGYGLLNLSQGTVLEGIVVDMTDTGSGSDGIANSSAGSCTARNCFVCHLPSGVAYGFTQWSSDTYNVHNCLVSDSAGGGYYEGGTGDMSLKNCVAWDCTLPFFGTFTDTEYNGDNTVGSGPGGGTNFIDLTGYTAAEVFTDASNDDYSLVDTSSPLFDAGTNLYSSGVTVDILGDARQNNDDFDIGPHKLDIEITDDYMVLGGNTMNLSDLQNEVRRVIGREDSTINARITQALNRALREWANEFPWEGLFEIGDLTHSGGAILTFPRRVARVAWVADATNLTPIDPGTRQWDREAPRTYLGKLSGRALQWEPAGISPIWTNITNYISLKATHSGDNRDVVISGVAYRQGGSDLLQTIEVTHKLGLSGETGVTLSDYQFINLNMVAVDNYRTSPASEVQVWCEGGMVGVIGPFDLNPQHQRVRFVKIPDSGTVFRYGAYLEPQPLVESYQPVPPNVDIDYLTWFAASDLLWQTREGERSAYARKMAEKVAESRRERERMFGDGADRIVPEDLT